MTELMSWACKQLESLGFTIKNKPEIVVNTPWSSVFRFETSEGYLYLKQTPEQLGLEAKIIQLLQDQFQASVPTVIAENREMNCFLMKDAGQSLRTLLKQQFNAELLCKTVEQFTSLQLRTAENIDAFLDLGVPDWRLDKLPDLYKELISQKAFLIEDGLSEKELNELALLIPMVSYLCKILSNYSIKETIVQPDFNDNNTLIDEASAALTTIDLGEIAISHPFFSLLNCLQQITKHYGFTEKDGIYQQVLESCLKNFMSFHSKETLIDVLKLAEVLWLVYGMLANYRLMMACAEEKIRAYRPGKFAALVKEFIATQDPQLMKKCAKINQQR